MPNIFDRLIGEAKKKKQQFEQNIATAAAPPPRPVAPPVAAPRVAYSDIAKQRILARNPTANVSQGARMPTMQPIKRENVFQKVGGGFMQGLPTAGLAAKRTAIGVGQDFSGTADLLSRGTGTSRVSKFLDTQAKRTDSQAQRMNVQGAYKAAQMPLAVSAFAAPGLVAGKVAKTAKVARVLAPVAKVGSKLEKPVVKVANALEKKGAVGRITAAGVRGGATPQMLANSAAGTLFDLGSESGKGRDISKRDVAISAAMNLGAGAALPAGARAAYEGAQAVKPTIKAAQRGIQASRVRTSTIDGIRTEQKRLAKEADGYQKQLDKLPLDSHKAQLAGEQYQRKISRNHVQIQQLEQTRPQRNLPQAVIDKTLTLNPGLSMKDVSKQPELPKTAAPSKLPAQQLPPKAPQLQGQPVPGQLVGRSGESLPNSSKPLPEYKTKQVSGRDKFFRDTQSIIERQGEHGKSLSDDLNTARDKKEIWLSELQQSMPTVSELAMPKVRKSGLKDQWNNKSFENFVEAVQGRAEPVNSKVARAVQEWKANAPGIRNRGVNAGLEIGDQGDTYYPHVVDYDAIFKDKNKYNASINHLVETGQAETPEAAIALLNHVKDISRNREYGNLEASRLADIPFYDKTPNSLISYLNGSAKRITNAETFGAKDELALKKIADAGQQGYDTEAMKDAFNIAAGAKQYSPTASKVSGGVRKYVTTTRLGLGALTNTSQNVNTGIVTGHLQTLGAMTKQLDGKTKQFVADTGVISDALLNDLKTQQGYSSFSSKVFGKAVNKVTAPLFGTVEKFNRSVAATAGRDYALRLAQKGDEATLRKLGVTGAIKDSTLSKRQQIQAARKVVEKTQFKVDPQDLPGWADSPGGKMVAQFRTFSYNQSKFFSNEVLKPMKKGDFMPAARVLAALPVGYGLYETRRIIDGRPEEDDKKKVGIESFSKIGGAGLAMDIYRSLNPPGSKYIPTDRRVTMALGTLGGPAIGVGSQAVGAVSELIQRKKTPTDESRLEGKIALGKGENYTDATPAARFGLSQIPVVGTPIKNRLLPYKTTAEAEAGKSIGADSKGGSKATMTPAYKEYSKLKEADKKALAATDPEARGFYDQEQAMKKGMTKPGLRPVGTPPEAAKVLDKYDRMLPTAKDKVFARNKSAEYEYTAAKYLQDKAAGTLSGTEDIRRQQAVAKAAVGADFNKETRDYYGLTKKQLYDLVSKDPDGNRIAQEVIAYGDALQGNELGDNKFRNSKGIISIKPADKKTGSGGSKGYKLKPSDFKTPFDNLVSSTTKGASLARNAKLARKRA